MAFHGVPGGGGIALAKQNDNTLTAMFLDTAGILNVAWVDRTGKWNPLVNIGGVPGAPGAGIALARQNEGNPHLPFADTTGVLSVAWVDGTGKWNPPVPMGGVTTQPGAGVALAKQGDDILTAAFINITGVLSVAWVVGTGHWNPPQSILTVGRPPPVPHTVQSRIACAPRPIERPAAPGAARSSGTAHSRRGTCHHLECRRRGRRRRRVQAKRSYQSGDRVTPVDRGAPDVI